ncbi:hypothetical protein JAO76_15600 [Pontibacter sp. BT310]|uniref:Uncharacterized protein n=1 Tax=Pontibacter populi TaxID=890055 RepID=A0ABS6XER6_9BACT|nr:MULTISPECIES: hypothetical protein [Pontibacter]MBJ6119635.1 hypothetical protein [Pontibacter sp. BT310]MBR0572062.1 hypothetical protein [Microvirga sp. STS03]MBW3366488.1 hypothetical protein [Pontibacter populi]
METRQDLLTGEEFIPLRRNQRFASRANQVRYNNLLAQQKRDAKRPLDRALDTNRTILKRLLGEAKSVMFSRDYLMGAGYNLTAYTQIAENEKASYWCVYEFALTPLQDNKLKISRK